jgi:hypothetical protein
VRARMAEIARQMGEYGLYSEARLSLSDNGQSATIFHTGGGRIGNTGCMCM